MLTFLQVVRYCFSRSILSKEKIIPPLVEQNQLHSARGSIRVFFSQVFKFLCLSLLQLLAYKVEHVCWKLSVFLSMIKYYGNDVFLILQLLRYIDLDWFTFIFWFSWAFSLYTSAQLLEKKNAWVFKNQRVMLNLFIFNILLSPSLF